VFLGPTAWHSWKRLRSNEDSAATSGPNSSTARQILLCWIAAWFGFFTLVQTKLPNYILPAYPALALLMASCLDDWRCGRLRLPAWVMPTSLACLALIGIGVSVGLLIAGDALPLALHGRRLPGVQTGAWLGGVFVVGAAAAGWCWIAGRRGGVLTCVTLAGLVFTGGMALWGVNLVDRFKAPRALVEALPGDHLYREVRVGAFGYFQPSLVFYCQREVYCPENPMCAVEFLHAPLPVYLFVTEEMWEQLRLFAPTTFHVIAHHSDFYNGREILLVSNEELK
jgi:hypothetical protein